MTALTTAALGFAPDGEGWRKEIRGRAITFRLLREWRDLLAVERLQREVFGVSERDLTAASLLVVIPKTGGLILGAFADGELVGFLTGYERYVAREPRLVSDMLAVMPPFRGGLGFALKAFQAALVRETGFGEIVWTVDSLRAANARLNPAYIEQPIDAHDLDGRAEVRRQAGVPIMADEAIGSARWRSTRSPRPPGSVARSARWSSRRSPRRRGRTSPMPCTTSRRSRWAGR